MPSIQVVSEFPVEVRNGRHRQKKAMSLEGEQSGEQAWAGQGASSEKLHTQKLWLPGSDWQDRMVAGRKRSLLMAERGIDESDKP